MKKLAIADYEAASDKGNMRFYPNGRLIKSLLEKYVTDEVVKYGGSEVETPIMYDSYILAWQVSLIDSEMAIRYY